MLSSDFRTEARKKLSGKWGKVACITLVYMLIGFVFSRIEENLSDSMSVIVSIIFTIIEVPLAFGFIIALFKLFNEEEVGTFDFFSIGFNNFKRSWAISWRIFLKMIVPIILIIISYIFATFGVLGMAILSFNSSSSASSVGAIGIIAFVILIVSIIWAIMKSYYYKLSYFIAIENSDLTAKEAVEKSEELMNGKRGKLFYLQLSFIGWAILATIPLCIGYLWLVPYFHFATIAFYKFVSGNNSNIETEIVTENTTNRNLDNKILFKQ